MNEPGPCTRHENRVNGAEARLLDRRMGFAYAQPNYRRFSIKLYFALTSIIISQNGRIRDIGQCSRNMLSKIVKSILTIFSNLFFGTTPKMLNMIEFAVIFWIIDHNMMLSIG